MHFDCHRCDTMEFGVYPLIFSLSWFQVPGTKNQILAAVLYIRELLRAEWHRRQSLKVTIHFPKYLISWSFGSHKKNGNFFSWSFELCISVMIQDRWKFWWKNLSIYNIYVIFIFLFSLSDQPGLCHSWLRPGEGHMSALHKLHSFIHPYKIWHHGFLSCLKPCLRSRCWNKLTSSFMFLYKTSPIGRSLVKNAQYWYHGLLIW